MNGRWTDGRMDGRKAEWQDAGKPECGEGVLGRKEKNERRDGRTDGRATGIHITM